MRIQDRATANVETLARNVYPGRGLVTGLTPDGRCFAQVYWIMGRSENSRNRLFVRVNETVRTAPFDETQVRDPSLIIYNCVRVVGRAHVVSNGDQTDTIADALGNDKTFEQALYTRTFEPDAPNYTPRISGIVDLDNTDHVYQLAILKTLDGDPERPLRFIYNYACAVAGVGHCITTYSGDGAPLPSFAGEPPPVPLLDDIGATLDLYWSTLNADNKVSLLVKFIDRATGTTDIRIANKNAV